MQSTSAPEKAPGVDSEDGGRRRTNTSETRACSSGSFSSASLCCKWHANVVPYLARSAGERKGKEKKRKKAKRCFLYQWDLSDLGTGCTSVLSVGDGCLPPQWVYRAVSAAARQIRTHEPPGPYGIRDTSAGRALAYPPSATRRCSALLQPGIQKRRVQPYRTPPFGLA